MECKIIEKLFTLIMLVFLLLQTYYCIVKIVGPVMIKSTEQKFASKLEVPAFTLCRKGIVNGTDAEMADGAQFSLLGRCPNSTFDCIQEQLYTKKEDYIVSSLINDNFTLRDISWSMVYHFYSMQPYETFNCIEIKHPGVKVELGNNESDRRFDELA